MSRILKKKIYIRFQILYGGIDQMKELTKEFES